jgi:flagellar basal-body rod protein FlgG
MAYVEDDMEPVELGQLSIATFINEAGMKPIGDSLFRATVASGDAQVGNAGDPGFATIRQGYVEASNVNVVQEITSLISAQRAYEMNSKVVEAADQMMSTASNIR